MPLVRIIRNYIRKKRIPPSPFFRTCLLPTHLETLPRILERTGGHGMVRLRIDLLRHENRSRFRRGLRVPSASRGRDRLTIDRIAGILHDSLTGDILYRRLAGVGKHENDAELERVACAAVDLIFGI